MIFFHSIRVEVCAMLREAFDSVLTKLRWAIDYTNIYTTTLFMEEIEFPVKRTDCTFHLDYS